MRETDVHGLLRDGFPGQRMFVLPRPLVRSALEIAGLREILVTDSGCFPHADHHGRARPDPIDQGDQDAEPSDSTRRGPTGTVRPSGGVRSLV